jgi:ParB-like chromosome segregation protein Spo0J
MTIEIIGEAYLELGELVCSDGWAERLERKHVRELAENIKGLVLIHPPMVRSSDRVVIAGEDRVAACALNEETHVRVTLVECDDAELEAIRAAENRHRRSESGAELLQLLEEAEQAIAAPPAPEEAAEPVKRGRGRPKGSRNQAIERVAAETDRSVDAVRKAVDREERTRELATIELWGTTQPAEWLEPVLKRRAALTKAAEKLQAAMSTLTTLQKLAPISDQVSYSLHERLKEMAAELRGQRPACVCAWCKNEPALVEDCTACGGDGYLSQERAAMVPADLKSPAITVRRGIQVERMPEPEASLDDFFA